MKINFTKMHGCGNDYIYINCFNQKIDEPSKLSVKLSDRRYGIGGDGIILICPSNIADAKMRMFNIDGSEGKMCGNGIRCVGKYVYDYGIAHKDDITIETLSGVKQLHICESNGKISRLMVNMGKAELNPKSIPVKLERDNVINYEINLNGDKFHITCVSMGNPHCIIFVDDVNKIDVEKIGKKFENSGIFPEGVNVEFVQLINTNNLKMRVWERGSGETLACGTGACASVVAAVENGYCDKNNDVKVELLGGDLIINYKQDAVYMTGNAEEVFKGEIDI